MIYTFLLCVVLAGCSSLSYNSREFLDESDTNTYNEVTSDYDDKELDANPVFDDFFDGKCPAIQADGDELWVDDLEFSDTDSNLLRIGERKDVDNDGIVEQLIDGPFDGGFYLDCEFGELYVFPKFEHYGNVSYLDYDDGCRILYWDIKSGIQFYHLIKMNGTFIEEDTQFLYSEEYDGNSTIWKYRINGEEVEEDFFISEINRLLPGYF
jgi:hypothetical protein